MPSASLPSCRRCCAHCIVCVRATLRSRRVPDLGAAANYLWMMTGRLPTEVQARAVEQYLVATIDHGFNASTFTARVVASTGADVGACVVAAIGALSGPLHGGAPSRALDLVDLIGSGDRIDEVVGAMLDADEKIMGFGHAVYRTADPGRRCCATSPQRWPRRTRSGPSSNWSPRSRPACCDCSTNASRGDG